MTAHADPLIAAVIPAHNDARHLRRLLPALKSGLSVVGRYEIVVVANGCTDDTAAYCRQAGVEVLERPALTPAAARNEGTWITRARWLAFLDADVVPLPAWFERLSDLISAENESALVGWPVLVPPDAGWVPRAWETVRFTPERLPSTLDSGNLVMSRALFDRLGGFDDSRTAGEDVDLCERAAARGVRLVFDAGLTVYHYGEPARIRDFFRREVFHADRFSKVLGNCLRSALDGSLMGILVATVAGTAVGVVALGTGRMWGLALVLAGPLLAAIAAIAKVAVRWHPALSVGQFARMAFLCFVMMVARLAGMIVVRRQWRTG